MSRYGRVMEMSFPHQSAHRDSVSGRIDHKAMLATVISRQSNSQTVRALRRAELLNKAQGDEVAQRIHYFACYKDDEMAVSGAFWHNLDEPKKYETSIYQSGLINIKHNDLQLDRTGDHSNRVGHGVSRT